MPARLLLFVAAAGSVLLSAACSSPDPPVSSTTPPPTAPSVSPSAGWTIGLDSRPTMAIAGPDGVYVTSSGAAKYAPQIYRLALDDGRQLARRTAVGQPYDLAIAPDGQLWVAADRHIDQPAGTGITIQDPGSLVVVDQIGLPDSPLSLAQVAGAMWAGSRDVIFVVDSSSHKVTATYAVGGPAYQLLPLDDGQHVVVVEGDALEVVGLDGSSIARLSVDAAGSITAAVDGDTLWVRVPVGVDSELRSYALPDLVEGRAGPTLDAVSGGVAVAAGAAWATDDRAGSLVCVAGAATAAILPGDDAVGVLSSLPSTGSGTAGVLLATASGVQLRAASCTG